jgi:sugar-specific transcriptional regulator TrmB
VNNILIKSLRQLGCSDKHIRFYIANLELGAATLSKIIVKARLQRSTAYLIANEMTLLGLAIEDHKTYKKIYVAAEPDVILRKLEAKQRQIGRNALAFKEILPELRAAHHATTTRPNVRTYEGLSGLLAIRQDILAETQEVLLWTNQDTEQHIFDKQAHQAFITERVAKQIPIRVLAVDNPAGHTIKGTDRALLRTVKILTATIHFTGETYIYGDKIAVLDIGKNIFGVITQNKQIANSQRVIFELAWGKL